MTGTEPMLFADIRAAASHFHVSDGQINPV